MSRADDLKAQLSEMASKPGDGPRGDDFKTALAELHIIDPKLCPDPSTHS